MTKNLNVSLSFTADSSKVRAELNSLKKSLNELSSSTALKTPNFEFTKDLQEASRAAAQLKVQLDAAVNTKTGNLDLTKFSESMKKSGMSLEKYQNQLYQLGPAGEKAFADLTKAITMADVPLRRSSKLLDELWTTMKNTARWQLTSSAMHGFMGAVSSAYGYAKDLNASLNDIRIVTGATTEKMAEFAKEANNAAKALSTTTTDYTKASLIFYQQGLDDAQVKERTDITIKMANAAGASAEKVSDQLTAVWNNFYDGTKSLEYYADVMTALGAATASSTDEIAGGLEKFAAIGKTIGLSYEYAASALATITSNTRQSEEVVGTALKTIFARIQGLNLGETLDDGVTLNKYSQALEKVGISIFDSAGELKNMDNILDEMAAKWDTLNNSQQVALAQTVAGVRQYNQLIALMDNWNSGDSDSMIANLTTATNSTGTLQNQADIYAESWEAANKRVKASAEAVYSAILNDEFFIDLSNGFADLIDGVKIFIDSLGGVKGVLLAIGSIVTNVFSKQIGQGIQNAIFSLKGFVNPQAILDAEIKQKKKANELLVSGLKDQGTTSSGYSAEAYKALGENQLTYIQNVERMSEEEQAINQILMDRNRALVDNAIKAGEELEIIEEKIAAERNSLVFQAQKAGKGTSDQITQVRTLSKQYEDLSKNASKFQTVANTAFKSIGMDEQSKDAKELKKELSETVQEMLKLKDVDKLTDAQGIEKLKTSLKTLLPEVDLTTTEVNELWQTIKNSENVSFEQITAVFNRLSTASTAAGTSIQSKLKVAMEACGMTSEEVENTIRQYNAVLEQFEDKNEGAEVALRKVIAAMREHNKGMEEAKQKPIPMAQAFSKAASAVMLVGQAITTVTGIIDVFNDSEATTKDKIMALVSGIGMLVPAIMSIGSAFSTASVEVSIFGATTTVAMQQITLIVMAITALTVGIALLINHLNVYGQTLEQANKKLEQTSKDAENAANAVEDAKNAYQDLTDTIEDYQGAEDALDTLIEGTEEFKNQLKEANEYARKLMDTYGVKGTYNAEKGLWEISDEALEAGMSEYNKKLEQAYIENAVAQNALSAAKNHQAFAKLVAEDDKTQGEHTLENTNNQYYNDAASAADSPAAAAGLALGNLISSWIKSFEDVEQQEEQNKRQIEVLDEVLKYWDSYNGDLNKISQELNLEGIDSKSDLLSALGMTESALQDLMNSLSSNTEAILENNKFIIDNTWKNNEVYSESEHKDAINNLAAAEMMTESERILNQYDKYNDKQMEDLQKSYAKKKGLTFVSEEDGVAEFLDTEGKTVKFSNDSIKAFMAQEQALENVGVSLESFAENLNKLAQKSNEGDLAGALAYSQASGGDISDVAVGYADSDVQTFDSVESLQKYLNIDDKAFEALWKSKGFMSAEAYLESFNTQVSSFKDQVGKLDIAKDLSIFNELSLGVAQSIESSADKMNLGPLGQSAGEQYIAGLNSMLSGIKEEDQVAAMERLSSIDWSSWDAMQQAQVILSDFGKEIDTTDPYWKTFIDNMRVVNGSFPDFTKLQTNLQEISAILGSLDFGDVIKDEDYEKLVAQNQEWEKFFILQANGTRKFIGDSTEMLNATRENITAQREDLVTRKGLIEQVTDSKADWKISAMSIDQQYGDGKDGKLSDQNGIDHGYKSGEDMINNIMANQTRDLIDNNAAIKEILNNSGYDETAINDILQEARDGNRERLETMLTYVDDYMAQDLEASEEQLNEMMASTATSIADLQNLLNSNQIDEEAYDKQLTVLANTASSLEELQQIQSAGLSGEVGLDTYEYGQALLNLAEQYENCAEEAEEYSRALLSGNKAEIKAAQSALEAAIEVGELAEKYNLNAEELEDYSKRLKNLHKESNLSAKDAAKLASANMRLDRGVSNLNDNLDDYKEALKASNKGSAEWSNTLSDLKTDLADMLNIADGSMLSDQFAEDTLASEDLKLALDGDADAILRLRLAAADDIIANLEVNDTALASVQEQWNFLKDNLSKDIQAGGINDKAMVDAFNEMIEKGNMTKEQIEGALAGLNVSANVHTEYVSQKVSVPTTITDQVRYPIGSIMVDKDMDGKPEFPVTNWRTETRTHFGPPVEVKGYVPKYSIEGTEGEGSTSSSFTQLPAPTVSNSSTTSGKSSGGGGGSSISKSNKSTTRYKKIDDKLDDNERASEKLKNKISKTTGEEQKAAMDQLVEEEKKRKKLVEDKLKEAKEFKDKDQKALDEAAIEVGIEFKYDDEGNITNYEETMSKLYAELDAAEQAAIDKGDDLTDADKDHIEKLKEKIETLEDAMGTYEDTRELVEDLEDELETLAGMPPLPTATSDLVDIYKEVNDQLDDIEEKLERINNETDRLTGANRVKALKDAAKLEQDKLKTLKDQAEVIANDIVEKQDNLNTVAKRHGISFEYDENGNITNYDEQMGKLGDEYQAMYDEYAADGEITEAEQANLDAKQANIDEIQGYIDAYSDAVEEGEENAKSQLESFYNWQDKNAEALATTLEFNLEINERDLQRIEYYLGKIEDDFYSAAEAAAMMAGNMSGDGPLGEGGQLGEYLQNLQEYEKSYKALQDAFANGEISEEEYTNQLKTISDGMYENLGNINELDKAMMNYYGDTLAAAGEEIAKYTDQMEHQSSVLEHYASIMDIMGKSNDYEKMGKILEGQASVAADQAKAAKQTMELYQGQAAEKLALYQKALAAGDTAAAELYKKEYDAALAASTEAEEQYLAKTEAYAESLKAILENKLSGLAQDLENALTGGTSFDQMNAALSRAASLQEEYLTTTNQIYETNKLMRTAQQEIDKSSNSVAKNRLKQFIGETQELQNQNKLSKYELDIQQAKYNLLLAEIAVEEAQNAKSTVRLQRDSEGNFGYVYTADDQKTAEAEQKLADAQNRLYNIGLDGANQYTEKYQQTLSEMYSTLTDLQQQYLSGAFESEEEYNNAVAAAKEYYYQKLEQYSSLHAVALTTDSRVIEDAWSSQFSSMVYSTSQWKDKVDGYVDGAAQAFADWKVEMEGIEEELGLDDIEGAVDDIKEASNELLNELTKKDGVLDKVKEELTAVSDVTTAWANQRLTIQDLVGDYEDLTTSIDNTIKKMLEVPDNPPPEDPTEPETPTEPTEPETPTEPTPPAEPETPTEPTPPAEPETPTVKVGGLVNAGNAQIYDYAGDSSGEHQYFSNDPKYKVLKESGDWIQVRYHKLASGITGWFKKADVTALNTGGYTGDWSGSYGKLAFLHQKELVLNQGDTENFLAGMDLLNKIVSAIDLYSMNSQLGGMLSTPSLGHMNNENMLEQQVHIEASFPNATDHSEIEEAFNNLINQASQYANRK